MTQTWKHIPGYEGIYEVSNQGRVRRIGGWTDGRSNKVRGLRKLKRTKKGYMRVTLFRDATKKEYPVHVLVLLAFVGPKPTPDHETNHKDGKKSNNRLSNLEWSTHPDNQRHSYRVLKTPTRPGSKHHNAKITEDQALAIRALRRHGWLLKEIAAEFALSVPTVCWICKNKAWTHI